MTSVRKTSANRANARASTGPRTAEGKARASRNAQRHGLAVSVSKQPGYAAEIASLADKIAGAEASEDVLALAWNIAAAQIDLLRIRKARRDLMSTALGAERLSDHQNGESRHCLQGPAEISSEDAALIGAMDRYERRAMSRRKFAIRVLDAARAAKI